MLELLPVPIIIIVSLFYVYWKKAYISQIMVIADILIFIYIVILQETNLPLYNSAYDALTFRPDLLGDIYRLPTLVTSMFMHANLMHLVGNMLILYLIGLPLEERIGTKNWAIIYFSTGIIATVSFLLLNWGVATHLLGASGAIFGLGGAMLILYPKDKIPMVIGFFFTTQLPVWITVGFMFVFASFLVFQAEIDNIANIAHAGGAIAGIIIAPQLMKRSGHDKASKLDFAALHDLARTDAEHELLDNIEAEKIEDVKEAWLEQFFDTARCPNCSSPIKFSKKIRCQCGAEYRIYR